MSENGISVRPSVERDGVSVQIVYKNDVDLGMPMVFDRKGTFKLMWALFKATFKLKGSF